MDLGFGISNMFILDSLMISGIRWALETALTAAEAEMHDDSVLREQLLEAEMRREMGEITDDEFRDTEADLLARIREIKERREGGSGPIDMGAQPNRPVDDHATFARRKRGHVGPAAGEIEPHRRCGMEIGREFASSHCVVRICQAVIVGSSPRTSIRTP